MLRRRRGYLHRCYPAAYNPALRQVFIAGKNNDLPVRTLKSGDSFGELALMYNSPRTATVKVSPGGERERRRDPCGVVDDALFGSFFTGSRCAGKHRAGVSGTTSSPPLGHDARLLC